MAGKGPYVGRAWVQVIPTTVDAQKNISKELLPELDAAGKSGGEKLSGGIGSSLKAGAGRLAGIAKAALAGAGVAAVTKFVHDSVGAFSQFEQLSGGVQKIFDEIDTASIISDAQNAYKELGVSANRYLESMTSVGATFAATLGDAKGYDVAKEGLKAISDFASGTGRSVDQLTEKYTLITRATSSYQSIADQFAGLLPATSDEFLRQAKDAGLLGEQYEKLTDVPLPEYQESVTKMLTRGVDSMGLLGNAASEAYSTLEGSTAMMKASWENLMVAFGTGDQAQLQTALERMTESIGAWASNLLPRIATILGGIVQMLPKIIGDIISHIPEWTGQIAESVKSSLPGLVQGIGQAFGIDFDAVMSSRLVQSVLGLGTKIQEAFTKVFGDIDLGSVAGGMQTSFQTAGDIIGQVITSISDSIASLIEGIDPATLEAIFSTLRQVGETLLSVMATLGEQVVNVIVNLIIPTITTLWSFLEQVVLPGVMQIFETLRPGFDFVIGMIAQIAGWIAQLVSALVDFLAPVIAMIFEVAAPVISGILAGVADIWNSIFTAVQDIWNTISPFVTRLVSDLSAAFTTIGNWIRAVWPVVSWVCNQIGQGIRIVVQTITSMVSGLISGIGHIISGIIGTITGIINVVVDLVTGNFGALERDFGGLVSSIGSIIWGVVEAITSPFRYAFSQIRSLWNSTIGSMHFEIPDWVPGIGGAGFSMPKLAKGGTITGAGSVLVGEAGPELLTLPRGARVTPLKSSDAVSGGATYSVVVGDVDLTDDDQVKRVTRDYLEFLAGLAKPAGVVSV